MRQGKWSIPTTYNGILYRSKLEADWARFFDRHRMKYAYESEGFDLNGLWYLPDFYLPDIKTFVEVKGILDDTDRTKISALARAAAAKGVMVVLAEVPVGEGYRLVERTALTDEICLALCPSCGRWYFMPTTGQWNCPACGVNGHRDGIRYHHPNPAMWGKESICPDCGK